MDHLELLETRRNRSNRAGLEVRKLGRCIGSEGRHIDSVVKDMGSLQRNYHRQAAQLTVAVTDPGYCNTMAAKYNTRLPLYNTRYEGL